VITPTSLNEIQLRSRKVLNKPNPIVVIQEEEQIYSQLDEELLELLHTHIGFIFPNVFICLLVIIIHYRVSYILGENIPPGEYSLSVHTSV
jgi:hypothetical protein